MSLEQYPISSTLGKSTYSQTCTVNQNSDIVVKIINFEQANVSVEELKSSTTSWQNLVHPSIVKVDTFFEEDEKFVIAMENVKGKSLRRLIKESTKPLNENIILEIFYNIFLSLQYIHQSNKIHGNLKPENIFVLKNNSIKISDFLLSHSLLETKSYLAPEVLISNNFSVASDMWSVGCILFEMMELNHPFKAKNEEEMMQLILEKSVPSCSSYYSIRLQRFLSYLFLKNPQKRPDANDAVWSLVFEKVSSSPFSKLSLLNKGEPSNNYEPHIIPEVKGMRISINEGSFEDPSIFVFTPEQKSKFNIYTKIVFVTEGESKLPPQNNMLLISLSKSITSLGDNCFSDMTSVNSIEIYHPFEQCGIKCFSNFNIQNVVFRSSVRCFDNQCFFGCSSLESLNFPKDLISIGMFCFYNAKFDKIELPDSVQSIGSRAFSHCTSLVSVKLSSGLQRLESGTFFGCSSLKEILIPESVEYIAPNCFSGCTSLLSPGGKITFKGKPDLTLEDFFLRK